MWARQEVISAKLAQRPRMFFIVISPTCDLNLLEKDGEQEEKALFCGGDLYVDNGIDLGRVTRIRT